MRILSVDDDPVFLEIIKAELKDLGYTDVCQVSSGQDALELVRTAKDGFDCCLLDIDMPGMTGVELCSKLRAEPPTQDTPIIMVTSRAEMESVDRAFSVGATDYLNKPLNKRELRGRLKSTEALAAERAKRDQGALTAHGGPAFEIGDAIRLDPSAGCIEFVAMQNFILKLSSMQMFNRVAIGFRIQNVQDIFVTKSPEGFRDTLSDVAEMIIEVLGAGPKVMSYTGSGNFVVLLDRVPVVDPEDLAAKLSLSLSTLGEWYSNVGEIAPSLKIGKPVSRTFLSFFAPDEILDQAIDSAYSSDIEIAYQPEPMMRMTGSTGTTGFWN